MKKVESSQRPIVMKTNIGRRVIKRHWDIPEIEEKAWYDKESIAKIFSFSKLSYQYIIICDNEKEDAFDIHSKNGKICKFKRKEDLYYHIIPKDNIDHICKLEEITGVQYIETVA